MARTLLETSEAIEPVRVCAECQRSKTIRGVWYLVPGRAAASGASEDQDALHSNSGRVVTPLPFVCETCFSSSRIVRAIS